MLLYVNGDELSAGACCINDFVQADDDYRYTAQANKAHPENLMHSYGYYLSRLLNLGFRCEATVKKSNTEILHSVEEFAANQLPKLKSAYTVMCIGLMPGVDIDNLNTTVKLLESLNINFVLFNTKKPLYKSAELLFNNCINLYNESECFIPWCRNNNYQLKNNQYPDAQGHNAWAKYIFSKYVENNDTLR
jgi:hypothetical protein